MSDESRTAIRAFIVENFLFGDDSQPLANDLSLIDNDLIDSTGILELVGFLEERFAISIADADIVPANLDTIDRIAGFIARKQTA
ncbi:acyl carrier protein [Shinella curvata]|uniref:Acyl carrier protein n=1 Tax=Shinella curvata TaxID=1817964 RepID=A0ABT8XAQ3_9HYPH|nr:acyl carrier protein [Shinella curvata]MCJ8054906.1 acyl carrier protein [Shinella curvata]MDO6120698.1 acyl carrier protein [Shinella curvata]